MKILMTQNLRKPAVIMTKKWKDYTVEVFYKGNPVNLVDLYEDNKENAIRRAKTAIWMQALKDGREWHKDDIEAKIYQP